MVADEEIFRFGRLGEAGSGRLPADGGRWTGKDGEPTRAPGALPRWPGPRARGRLVPCHWKRVPGRSVAIPNSNLGCNRTAFARWAGWKPCAGGPTPCLILRSSRELPSVGDHPASGTARRPTRAELPAGLGLPVRRVGWTLSSTHAKYGRIGARNL